jgi:Skp family chaperone for outer membrane proteins
VLPGQDVLIAQLGIAGVFLVAVIFAVIVLWKSSAKDREAWAKAQDEARKRHEEEREQARAEHIALVAKMQTEAFKAIDQSRAEFLAESRRRDDIFESRLNRFEERVLQLNRDNNATVQILQDKVDKSVVHIATVTDALAKRLTI